jgi:acyl carrier protein
MGKIDVKEVEGILMKEVAVILALSNDDVAVDVPLPDMGIDSLGFVELLVVIEKRFKLKLIESGLTQEDFETIKSLAQCIIREGVE